MVYVFTLPANKSPTSRAQTAPSALSRGDDAVFIGLHSTRRALQSTQQQRLGEQHTFTRVEIGGVSKDLLLSGWTASPSQPCQRQPAEHGGRPCATPAARGGRRRGCRRLLLGGGLLRLRIGAECVSGSS